MAASEERERKGSKESELINCRVDSKIQLTAVRSSIAVELDACCGGEGEDCRRVANWRSRRGDSTSEAAELN